MRGHPPSSAFICLPNDSVRMLYASSVDIAEHAPWQWDRHDEVVHLETEQPMLLPTDEPRLGEADGYLSSDSGSEVDAGSRSRVSQSRAILDSWGITCSADDVPVLCLPAPVAFLIFQKKWTRVFLRAKWHTRLVDRQGNIFAGRPLFDGTVSGLFVCLLRPLFFSCLNFSCKALVLTQPCSRSICFI